ncbi:hypothetical protein BO71DRAFT_397354 [Aspergillus ellipticus CBS 707.79]|uniref:Uncharacterized protein n=1 Tax=Aspergillus ellipticus CBS 707.79 TaxID=1448320 RepID=A0A319DFI9_9EURO|nr:hypothetical protein BO71DRAFT_397354 [Aspergillus ellipticus CBS 707.79]
MKRPGFVLLEENIPTNIFILLFVILGLSLLGTYLDTTKRVKPTATASPATAQAHEQS